MFFSTSLTDMIYTHIDTDTISMYESAIHTWWLLVTCIFHLSGQQIKVATSSGFGPRRAWDFLCWKLWKMGLHGLLWPLICCTFGRWMFGKTLLQTFPAKFADLFVCAKDAVNCTNSREERPYEYIAGFKASLGSMTGPPWMLMIVQLIRREMGRWKFQCKELLKWWVLRKWRRHYYRWIFWFFWVFWTFEDGKMVEQLVP